ncbi:hypothetical protein C8F04DRAFT_1180308 [Mycena alexandri]|uniref:Uncharacterized protein n=1 Tax=Mycena alexandri TaxID=1745969 RepID=A0AAD6X5P1_9AGAR|nr:hypothetical protein C8F04DRAFT_1180308 [Mycena alexandri]
MSNLTVHCSCWFLFPLFVFLPGAPCMHQTCPPVPTPPVYIKYVPPCPHTTTMVTHVPPVPPPPTPGVGRVAPTRADSVAHKGIVAYADGLLQVDGVEAKDVGAHNSTLASKHGLDRMCLGCSRSLEF